MSYQYDTAAYVEGVPVKISEKYRPPRKVTWTPLCNFQVDTDVLTAEYELTTEEEALKFLQNLKNYKLNRKNIRNEKIRLYEEEKEKLKQEERNKLKKLEEEKKLKEEEERERLLKEQAQHDSEESSQISENETLPLSKEICIDNAEDTNAIEEDISSVNDGENSRSLRNEESVNIDSKTDETPISLPSSETLPQCSVSAQHSSSLSTCSVLQNSISVRPVQQLSPGLLTQSTETVQSPISTPLPQSCASQLPQTSVLQTTKSLPQTVNFSPSSLPSNRLGYTYDRSQTFVSGSHTQTPYSSMLIPTQCTPQVTNKLPTKESIINFADFEGDSSDPFDSAALKSINDMEELAKILQSASIKQQKNYSAPNANNSHYAPYMNGGYSYSMYPYMSYQPSSVPLSNSNLYNQIPSHQTEAAISSNTSVPLVGKTNTPFKHDSYPHNTNFSQWNTPNMSREQNKTPMYNYNYAMPQNVLSTTKTMGLPVKPSYNIPSLYANVPSSQLVGSPSTSSSIPTQNSNIDAIEKRDDLEEFYTRYYSNKKTTGGRSGENTPTLQQQNAKTLSSSSSVPDLTAAEDSEVSNIVCQPENVIMRDSKSFTPPRPSSTGGYETVSRASQLPNKPLSNTLVKSKLPDPFTELNEEAQSLVQSIAEMGFPQPRVARAVQKLGTDHKKLLEVLLTLQSFQESGEDEYLSERAFYYFMGQVDKVNEFLLAAKTLLDLGFEEEKVVERLLRYDNDKEKCLEELIT